MNRRVYAVAIILRPQRRLLRRRRPFEQRAQGIAPKVSAPCAAGLLTNAQNSNASKTQNMRAVRPFRFSLQLQPLQPRTILQGHRGADFLLGVLQSPF